jgi:ribosomal protein L39E
MTPIEKTKNTIKKNEKRSEWRRKCIHIEAM